MIEVEKKKKKSDIRVGSVVTAEEVVPEHSSMKKKKKKKDGFAGEDVEIAEENDLTSTKDAKKKRKGKHKCGKSDKDVTTSSSKSTKRVKFSDQVDIIPAEDEDTEEEEVAVVRVKRFTKKANELVKIAVLEYIDNHALDLKMVMESKSHPRLKGCWKEIASALPWRAYESVYSRAYTLFEAGSKRIWTKEDLECVREFQKRYGNDWRKLVDEIGKQIAALSLNS